MSHSLQPHGLQPTRLLCPWHSLGKNTGMGSHSLLQGISPTQGSNLGLLHCMQIPAHLSHQESAIHIHTFPLFWISFPFRSSQNIEQSSPCYTVGSHYLFFTKGFPGSSVSKESTCKARDPSWITGLGRSPGEEIGYPFQYSWTSLVAQTVKNQPSVPYTWVQFLGWEDPLEEGMATYSTILAWRMPMNRGAWQDCSPWGGKKSEVERFLTGYT